MAGFSGWRSEALLATATVASLIRNSGFQPERETGFHPVSLLTETGWKPVTLSGYKPKLQPTL